MRQSAPSKLEILLARLIECALPISSASPALTWEVDMIDVQRLAEGDPLDFEVVVREGRGETRHHVTMSREMCKRLTASNPLRWYDSPMKQPDPHTSRWTKPTENCSHQANP